jgi:hypothetical protein
MPFEDNNEIITGFFETNETPHRHTSTDLLVNMDPDYVYNIAKAATGAMLHFAKATTSLNTTVFDDNQISFFPVPAKETLSISLGNLATDSYTFSLVNLQGKVVLNQTFTDVQLIESVALKGIAKGMYLAVLETENNRITKKIVIE